MQHSLPLDVRLKHLRPKKCTLCLLDKARKKQIKGNKNVLLTELRSTPSIICFHKHILVYCLAVIWESLSPGCHVENRQELTCTNTHTRPEWLSKQRGENLRLHTHTDTHTHTHTDTHTHTECDFIFRRPLLCLYIAKFLMLPKIIFLKPNILSYTYNNNVLILTQTMILS